MVVGGHAVSVHGAPRFTDDFDVWVDATLENGERVVAALADFGLASLDLRAEDFARPDVIVQLGYPPYRIDILTGIAGVTFDDCYSDRDTFDADGLTVPVIGKACLLANKRAAGRSKDLWDVEELGGNAAGEEDAA